MHDKSKAISVIIPSYNGRTLLEKNISTILNQLESYDEVIVVDDGSQDDTQAYIVERLGHPQVRVYSIASNARFARAANHGVEAANNAYIFLCNNDVRLQEHCLTRLRSHIGVDNLFAVGCLEYEDHIGGKKSGKNKLWFSRGLYQHSAADTFESGPTAWASGGSALFDRQKWLQLGGFDEKFSPAYWEDVDLSFRAHQRGWLVLFDADAVVLHKHETTNAAIFGKQHLETISWKHGQYFTWKHASLFRKLLFLVWWPYWFLRRSLTQ
ncbi:MAG: hypothetical protein COU67_00800 [Candidatus Pacebacteria bacterium CG10_big_fil_rev_8_21_14_0_10_44_54]|nr:glycosyltransferase family 2 protein [Candidatus Paceibacterota bacterium]PIR60808.1 MAG: hypothetical protein COU67_00800 [Candidatus Pacebacteria bacterium CG10_big_fil_rev_8_21_14_0_10_44_54]